MATANRVTKAYVYLTEKWYLDDCEKNEKRIIRKKAQKFVVRDGELQYKNSECVKVPNTVWEKKDIAWECDKCM